MDEQERKSHEADYTKRIDKILKEASGTSHINEDGRRVVLLDNIPIDAIRSLRFAIVSVRQENDELKEELAGYRKAEVEALMALFTPEQLQSGAEVEEYLQEHGRLPEEGK